VQPMNESAMRRGAALAIVLLALDACSHSSSAGVSGGAGAGGGVGGGGGTGASAGVGSGGAGGTTDGGAGSGASDAATPPSCAPGGVGLGMCGGMHESCCTTLPVASGSYDRTYDGGADSGADPASVSAFRLDKYDVTVGRFRQFVKVVAVGDAGTGWLPAEGAGKHVHLASGAGLVDVDPDAGAGAHESGWSAADDVNIAPTNANLTSCGAASTWTPTPGAQEDAPINCVNWYEAYAFCIWDGGFLPSEAEWGYAAAGGDQQRQYPWGSTDPGTTNDYAVFNCQYPDVATGCGTASGLAPVGTASQGVGRWGQLDLVGELQQWTLDWIRTAYVTPCADGALLTGGSSRVLRGCQFRDPASHLVPTYRDANSPTLRNDFIGVRCARSP
jgi:formylglycine-generating enzyme